MANSKTDRLRYQKIGKVGGGEKHNNDIMREFIAQLKTGKNLTDAAEAIGERVDGKILYLRRKYPKFNNQVAEYRWGVAAKVGEDGDYSTPESEWGVKFEDERLHCFLLTLRETGSRDTAARSAGMKPSTIMSMLDPTHKNYSAEFARAMNEEDQRRSWRIEDLLWQQAEQGDSTMARFVAERTNPKFGQRAKSATDANNNEFNSATLRETLESLKALISEVRRGAVTPDASYPDKPGEELTN